jgi:hypothetical protein
MTAANPPNFLLINYFEFLGFSELSRVLERKKKGRGREKKGKRKVEMHVSRN